MVSLTSLLLCQELVEKWLRFEDELQNEPGPWVGI
jgi:hypothetical protein